MQWVKKTGLAQALHGAILEVDAAQIVPVLLHFAVYSQ